MREEPAPGAPRVLYLLALAAGLGVANLYYGQPLAETMARSLGVSPAAIGLCLMSCQIGYALGMLLLVPLGDGRERRGLMTVTALSASLALLFVALSPSYALLLMASGLLGFASCLPQMAVPYAVSLVPDALRGKALGTVMSGLLAGILLSRTASGLLGGAIGWRLTFACAAGLMAALALVLRFGLNEQRPERPLPWAEILRSLAGVLRSEPLLRRHALMGALGFASFSAFWSTLSFQLADIGYGAKMAGLFGVLGLTGVVAAPIVGRVSGRVHPTRINAWALLTLAASFVVLRLGARSLIGLALGTVLLDSGAQSTHLANQHVIMGIRPEIRNRLNAIYMVSFFLGGAFGTTLAAYAWQLGGFRAVCAVGGALALFGLVPLWRRARPD